MKKKLQQPGFSLIEILVSTTLFVIIITGALSIFKLVIESQRGALATQNVEEGLKYFLEVTSKEIRMAKRNNGKCALPSNDIYQVSSNLNGDTLTFRNYHDECVTYSLAESGDGVKRFMIVRDGVTGYYITPARINVSELGFKIGPSDQPTVTMKISAYALGKNINKASMRIQTTLNSRYYKKD